MTCVLEAWGLRLIMWCTWCDCVGHVYRGIDDQLVMWPLWYFPLVQQEVCHQYWPTTGIREFGEYTVDLLGEEELEGFVLRTLSVLESRVYTRPLSCSYSLCPSCNTLWGVYAHECDLLRENSAHPSIWRNQVYARNHNSVLWPCNRENFSGNASKLNQPWTLHGSPMRWNDCFSNQMVIHWWDTAWTMHGIHEVAFYVTALFGIAMYNVVSMLHVELFIIRPPFIQCFVVS